ncbi:MAG: Z1 domain-containing protein, partial [Pseudomonadota bacterium]
MLKTKGWDDDTVQSIDDASTKVVFNLDFPGQAEFKTKGLVLGYVQSGKTANFTAVMSKAADAGFRLFIVLSGMTNSLRQQTQQRIDEELVALQHPTDWLTWTTQDSDIGDLPFNITTFLDNTKRHLAVVKKNGPRLRRLLRMIREAGAPMLGRTPVMIIDDECDQASVNASGVRGRRTVINRLLNDLIAELPKVSYVGYTATPYANVLIEPAEDDVYPSDFIVSLPRPGRYFGAERLFGRDLLDADTETPDGDGLDMIRVIGDSEAARLRPASRAEKDTFRLEVTETLRKAVLYFWLATAARAARGDDGEHSTMLIHTTVYAQAHKNAIPQIEAFRNATLKGVRQRDPQLLSELRELWRDEAERIDSTGLGRQRVEFDQLSKFLADTIKSSDTVAENAISDERLDYKRPGRRYIVIGGNVLARGLTIEGLVTSFFLRTSSQYDSLMQMGRWFGYRNGYEDLPRIYMTADMAEYFKDMATVEAELRYDIETYERENLTPTEFAVRIRRHPALAITARNKMLAAVDREVSFNGRHVQTRKFYHLNQDWLEENWSAGASLLDNISEYKNSSRGRGKPLYVDIPYTRIIDFLNSYNIHDAHEDMAAERLRDYISRQVQQPSSDLAKWNVGVMTGDGAECQQPLGHAGQISSVRRSQLKYSKPESADIKALAGLP